VALHLFVSQYATLLYEDDRSNEAIAGALFQCFYLFSIACVYQLTPTLPCVVTKHCCTLVLFN